MGPQVINGEGNASVRADPRYLYEELASFIAGLVHSGTLSPGSRVPSLRQISRQRKIGLSTALQAYRLLEDRGVIEARPQSGFYVANPSPISLQPPTISKPPGKATTVAISGIVLKLLEYAADPRFAPLGCAVPSAELLAAGRLDRFLARAARVRGTSYNVYTEPKGNLQLRQEIARRALHWGQASRPGMSPLRAAAPRPSRLP
jgi:DNA-binding transcriptional MocR family regulator